MAKIVVDSESCKGCGLCFNACPKGLIKAGDQINSSGFAYAVQIKEEECIGCKLCGIVCPDAAISVYK